MRTPAAASDGAPDKVVTLIPGDGIGPEVSAATRRVVDALGAGIEWDVHEAGAPAVERYGTPLPPHVLDSIRTNRIALKGPVTTPVGTGFRSINVALRQELDLFASVRPCRLYPGVPSRFAEIDIVVVRENTEDLYEGIEFECGTKELEKLRGFLKYMHGYSTPRDTGISVKPISVSATRAIVEFAFELAKKHRRRKVTLGHKANIMKFSDGVWLETGLRRAEDYRDVGFEEMQVDELAMWLVWHPDDLDVVVLPNLYGDIISDLCAGLIGGLGVAPGMNLGKEYAVFEPTHGSAPDIAGKGLANPIAMILSAVLMLRHLDMPAEARRLEDAVAAVLATGPRPADLKPDGPPATTDQIADAIVSRLSA
ncbi:MAG TPA: isocitrate/isopropylmalate dehydrogenase family protein [Actinomycetota bacterium]|nr:isocitrate/isopropylmalate dehydrogenase family protein [Actinomycetota bacterium]